MEFLVTMTTHVPDGTSGQAVNDVRGREAARPRELAGQGHLLRLWVLPRQGRALGLWRARDAADAGDPRIAAAVRLDDRGDHAAHRAPERPGDHGADPDAEGGHHHRRLSGHRRRPGRRVPQAGLGGSGERPDDHAVAGPRQVGRRGRHG